MKQIVLQVRSKCGLCVSGDEEVRNEVICHFAKSRPMHGLIKYTKVDL